MSIPGSNNISTPSLPGWESFPVLTNFSSSGQKVIQQKDQQLDAIIAVKTDRIASLKCQNCQGHCSRVKITGAITIVIFCLAPPEKRGRSLKAGQTVRTPVT